MAKIIKAANMTQKRKVLQTAKSEDGSYTAYSQQYGEHYHSTKDGALRESLYKHVIPAADLVNSTEVHILDICFGLGLNTLATAYYYKKYKPQTKVFIYSPELDAELIASLDTFEYPPTLQPFKNIITALQKEGFYKDGSLHVELFLGDAREYIKRFFHKFDIVYQDAFSPSANPALWTQEYFADIKKAMVPNGVLTTYSTALSTRLALHVNGFYIYLNEGEGFRRSTIAALKPLPYYKTVDMEHKISCNPDATPLQDKDL